MRISRRPGWPYPHPRSPRRAAAASPPGAGHAGHHRRGSHLHHDPLLEALAQPGHRPAGARSLRVSMWLPARPAPRRRPEHAPPLADPVHAPRRPPHAPRRRSTATRPARCQASTCPRCHDDAPRPRPPVPATPSPPRPRRGAGTSGSGPTASPAATATRSRGPAPAHAMYIRHVDATPSGTPRSRAVVTPPRSTVWRLARACASSGAQQPGPNPRGREVHVGIDQPAQPGFLFLFSASAIGTRRQRGVPGQDVCDPAAVDDHLVMPRRSGAPVPSTTWRHPRPSSAS